MDQSKSKSVKEDYSLKIKGGRVRFPSYFRYFSRYQLTLDHSAPVFRSQEGPLLYLLTHPFAVPETNSPSEKNGHFETGVNNL
jgi:hypothetical protein